MIGSMGWSWWIDGVAVDIELIEHYRTVCMYTAIFWIAVFGYFPSYNYLQTFYE